MAAYTDKQAKAKAQQIHERFGELIHAACVGTGVKESFLAGFTGVEAGIDRKGQIKPEATRFEPGVYSDLISLRDNGYCFVGGKRRTTYSGVKQSQVADADDDAVRALSTSYGCSQIMGWHVINNLDCTIAELRDTNKHFGYTVELLKIVGGPYMRDGDLEAVLHIWNTGSANGKTYHADYVDNALKVKKFYEEELKKPNVSAAVAISPGPDAPRSVSQGNTGEPPSGLQADPNGPPKEAQSPTTQVADQITNIDGGKAVPDNFVPETKTVEAPAKEGTTAAATKLTVAGIVVPSFMVGTVKAIQSAMESGFVDAKTIGDAILGFITNNSKYVFAGLGMVIGMMLIKKAFKQVTFWLQMWINSDPNRHDVEIKPQ